MRLGFAAKKIVLIGKKDLLTKIVYTRALVRSPRRRRPSRHHGLELGVIHLPGPVRVRLPNQLVDVDGESEILRGKGGGGVSDGKKREDAFFARADE